MKKIGLSIIVYTDGGIALRRCCEFETHIELEREAKADGTYYTSAFSNDVIQEPETFH